MRPKGQFVYREDLSAIVTENMLKNAQYSGYVAHLLFPYFWVKENSGTYPVLPLKSLYNLVDTKRTSSGGYNRAYEEFEQGHFVTKEHGLEGPVDDRNKAIYKSVLDMEELATMLTLDKVQLAHETRVAEKLNNINNFPTNKAKAAWTDYANADPHTDITTGIELMREGGVSPNTLQVDWWRYNDLLKCDAVKDAVHYMFPDTKKTGNITKEHLEAYLPVDQIIVSGALFNKSNPKKAPKLSGIWSDEMATLCLVARQEDQVVAPCVGRTLIWNEGESDEFVVEDYREEDVRADIVRVRHDVDIKLLKSFDEDDNVLSDISRRCGLILTDIKGVA